MYKLMKYFSVYDNNPNRYPKLLPKNFEYLNSRLYYNLNELTSYYRFEKVYVKRLNPFIYLLNDISLILTNDVFETYDNVVSNSVYFVSNYNFTTTKQKGKPLKDVIFKNIDEFFLLEEDSSINIIDFESNWRDYESIKVISTDSNEILFSHPYNHNPIFTNFIIYKVDIVALVLQFHYWLNEQTNKDEDTNIALFLHQIPFLNLLKSYNEITLNNFYLTYKDKEDLIVTYDRVNDNILNIDNYLNKVAKEWKQILSKQRYKSYYDFTKRFYSFDKSLYEINKIITIVDNENEWLYLLAILNELSYYIDYIIKDKEFIEDLKITLKEFKRKNIRLDDISKFYLFNLISSIEEKIK